MLCIRCGRCHNGTYGQRCENCWALAQASTGIVGVPYLSGLGEQRLKKKADPQVNPDFAAILSGSFVKM